MQNAIPLSPESFVQAKETIDALAASGTLTDAQIRALSVAFIAADNYFLIRAGKGVSAHFLGGKLLDEYLDVVRSIEAKTVEYRALVDAFFDLPEGVEEKELEGPKPGFYPPKDLPRIELLRMLTGDADCGPYVAYRPDEAEPSKEELVARLLGE